MKTWLKALVSFGVLAVLLFALPWGEVRESASRLTAGTWAGVLAVFLAGHALGTAKWRLILNAGRSGLERVDAVRCYAAGLFANLCLPSIVGGDVLRAALAGKATGRPEAAVLGGIADRLVDVLGLGLIMGAGGLAARGALPGWGGQLLVLLIVLGAGGGVGLLAVALRRPLARWPRRLRRPIGRSLVALRRLARSPGAAATALVAAILIQSAFVLVNAWLGRAIGIDVPLAVWFVAWPMAKLAGLLPVSLGGLGVRDATLAALLVPVGVPAARGVVASLLWQTVLIAGGLIAGLVWWRLGRRGDARRPAPVSAPRPATSREYA